jgi:hypothetical protein
VKKFFRPAALLLLVTMCLPAPALLAAQAAQTPAQPAAAPPGSAGDKQLPVDMAKIREALKQNPQLRLDTDELRFYVSIIGSIPTFEDILGDFDLKHGVVPGAGMTHEEYLARVNQDLNTSGGITALDTLQVALTSYGLISLVKKAYEEYKEAKTDRERRLIQERIEREIRDLERRRAAARDRR